MTRRGVNDGDEWPFLVDLGAQITMLTPEEVEEAGLEMDTEPAQVPTMGPGPEGERPVFHRGMVESLRFGSLVFRATPLYRADLPVFVALGYADRPAGILGNDLMGC